MRVSEIRVKQIRVKQGLGVQIHIMHGLSVIIELKKTAYSPL